MEFDVLIVGAGIVGVSAGLAAARAGASVLIVEREPEGPPAGSSRGTARIVAPAPFPDDDYVEMGLRALDGWHRIERESDQRLLELDGVLSVGPFAEHAFAALEAAGAEAEMISSTVARERFGVKLDPGRPIMLQPQAGVIRAGDAHAAIIRLVRAADGRLVHGAAVDLISDQGDAVEVRAGERRWRCGAAVIAAGPWTASLAADCGFEVTLDVTEQSVAYLPLPQGSRPIAVIDYEGDEPYALWDPERGLKAALHLAGDLGDATEVTEWARRVYPGIESGPAQTETCMYTRTPDERFAIERRGRVVLASACNGQGFQFAPETGERVAALALGAQVSA